MRRRPLVPVHNSPGPPLKPDHDFGYAPDEDSLFYLDNYSYPNREPGSSGRDYADGFTKRDRRVGDGRQYGDFGKSEFRMHPGGIRETGFRTDGRTDRDPYQTVPGSWQQSRSGSRYRGDGEIISPDRQLPEITESFLQTELNHAGYSEPIWGTGGKPEERSRMPQNYRHLPWGIPAYRPVAENPPAAPSDWAAGWDRAGQMGGMRPEPQPRNNEGSLMRLIEALRALGVGNI